MAASEMAASETATVAPLAERGIIGATDCHLHIFGPSDRYPYTPDRAYTPPEASLASYDALALGWMSASCRRILVSRRSTPDPGNSLIGERSVTLEPVTLGRIDAVLDAAPVRSQADVSRPPLPRECEDAEEPSH
jgi:hypothetical protein